LKALVNLTYKDNVSWKTFKHKAGDIFITNDINANFLIESELAVEVKE